MQVSGFTDFLYFRDTPLNSLNYLSRILFVACVQLPVLFLILTHLIDSDVIRDPCFSASFIWVDYSATDSDCETCLQLLTVIY